MEETSFFAAIERVLLKANEGKERKLSRQFAIVNANTGEN